jgi:hypothetical protein
MQTYTLTTKNNLPCIICLQCGSVSYNAGDITTKFCNHCKEYHEFPFLSEEKNLEWIKMNYPELQETSKEIPE